MKLILFDIDGTLLHSDGVGSAATKLAMQEVFGTLGTLAQFRFGGKTDWQMLLETLDGLVPADEIQRRLPEYDDVLARHISSIIDNYQVRPCIGAPDLLRRSLTTPEIVVGILTANMPQTAFIKLRAAGYDPSAFAITVFGSDAIERTALAPIALARVRQATGYGFSAQQMVIIGDTPEDIACARSIGAYVIAVATGRYSREELADHQADVVLENLADTEQVWSLLKGNLCDVT